VSVGAGLVTVLFVFAINIAGEEPPVKLRTLVPGTARRHHGAVRGRPGIGPALPNLRAVSDLVQPDRFAKVLWKTAA